MHHVLQWSVSVPTIVYLLTVLQNVLCDTVTVCVSKVSVSMPTGQAALIVEPA